jgi:hypothetical protein
LKIPRAERHTDSHRDCVGRRCAGCHRYAIRFLEIKKDDEMIEVLSTDVQYSVEVVGVKYPPLIVYVIVSPVM